MIIFILTIYNEEENLPSLLTSIRSKMEGRDYKIIAVDDGSRDGSRAILERMAGPDLTTIHHSINLNVGAVFSTGINKALEISGTPDDIVIILESDNTSSIDLVDTLEKKITDEGYDVVIASRYAKGGRYANFPLMRLVYSKAVNKLMKWMFAVPNVQDYTIFFRAYRLSVLERCVEFFGAFNFIRREGFVSNSEILIKLGYFTDRITEVPFIYDYGRKKGKSKLKVLYTIFEYFLFFQYMRDMDHKIRTREVWNAEQTGETTVEQES